jgi:hypothetical protein
VGQFEGCAIVSRYERAFEPGEHRSVLPGHGERLRLLAAFDDAAGVALESIATADLEVAADREEPPGDACSVRESVPEVGLVGRMRPASDRDFRRCPVA